MRKRAQNLKDGARVSISAKAPLIVKRAVESIAGEEDRPFSNMVARLLEESPRVQQKVKELQAAA